MNPPRIALVRQKYNAAGGAERFVSRAIQALADDGVHLTLLTRQWEPLPGMQAIELNPFHIGNVWRDAGFARAVCRAQQDQHFDLVQSHERLAVVMCFALVTAYTANGWPSGAGCYRR